MARSTPSRASDSPRDAVALLKQDHRTVDTLFREFEDAEQDEQSALAERACQLLTVHAQIEEEILYPAAREALEDDEEDLELVNEAAVEHASVKDLIAKIEGMTPDDENFKATVKVLGEYVKHHVKEEENELFPKLKKTELDLREMGGELADRKFALMEQMGIAEETAPRKRSAGSRPQRAAAGRARATRKSSSRSSSSRSARH